MAKTNKDQRITDTLARSEDGAIQITLSIPAKTVEDEKKKVLYEAAKETEIPGFRKGKAPISEVQRYYPQEKLKEKILGRLLPRAFADVINKYKIKPVVYPRFELLRANEKENWEIRATTCELPEVNLGNFRRAILDSSMVSSIWTPQKAGKTAQNTNKQEKTKEEKQQLVIKILLERVEVKIPALLIRYEVDLRLSQFLERLEKLGLALESYLGSIGKTHESLRQEYEKQTQENIKLDLILTKIADEEDLQIDEKQIDAVVEAAKADPKLAERLNTAEQRLLLKSVLRRRAALDSLVSLL